MNNPRHQKPQGQSVAKPVTIYFYIKAIAKFMGTLSKQAAMGPFTDMG